MVGVLSNKISREELKPGDHIYTWKHSYLYSHHGIYVGDGKVIHFTRGAFQEIGSGTLLDHIIFSSSPSRPLDTPCPVCGDQSRLDGVICSCIECFLSGGELYIFQYGVSPSLFLLKVRGGTCTLATSDPPKDVLHRAEFLLQNGFGVYDIFKNNCEDFAIYCKTSLLIFTSLSVGRSGQAASILAAASAIVSSPLRFLTTSFSGLALVSCGIYCISRFVSDIGVRRDVIKVPVERLVTQSGLDDSEVTTEASTERLVAQSGLDDSEVTTEASTERLVAQSGLDDSEVTTEPSSERLVAQSSLDDSEVTTEASTERLVAQSGLDVSEVTTEASTERLVAQSGLNDLEVTTEAATETVEEDKICPVDQNHVD